MLCPILLDAYNDLEKMIIIKIPFLWKEFNTLLMKEKENIQAFFTHVCSITNQIRTYEDMIMDVKMYKKKAFRSLLSKYDHIVADIESKDLTKISQTKLLRYL